MKGVVLLLLLVLLGSILLKLESENQKKLSNYEIQSSELALLMRFAHEQAKLLRSDIVQKKELSEYDSQIEFITNAEPTRPSVQGPEFEAFARYYISMNQKAFEKLDKHNYNEMIASCVACHNEYCPGPIRTIKKLAIK
jgi:cytochrome c553